MSIDHSNRNLHTEDNRGAFVLSLFAIVGLTITGAMSLVAITESSYTLAASLLVASATFLTAFIVQRKTRNTRLSSFITISSLYILMIYLVHDGGVANTGPIWMFMVSPVAFFIRGLKQGLIETTIFLTIIVLIMFVPGQFFSNESYQPEMKMRLVLSFLTVTFLSACYEYSREQAQKHMRELSKQHEQLALLDHLTDLPNRRSALQKLDFEKPRFVRDQTPLSVILCDIDHFKSVNDRYGHDAGDQVLVEISKVFTNLIRAQDMVSRWGGEEFLFILPGTDTENALRVSEKIHQAIKAKKFNYAGTDLSVTVSMGIAQMEENQAINELIHNADEYLYKAKNSGRNQTQSPLGTTL